jgi:hypothetical protein
MPAGIFTTALIAGSIGSPQASLATTGSISSSMDSVVLQAARSPVTSGNKSLLALMRPFELPDTQHASSVDVKAVASAAARKLKRAGLSVGLPKETMDILPPPPAVLPRVVAQWHGHATTVL